MHTDWQQFLVQSGAMISSGCVTSFGKVDEERSAALNADMVCDLSHYALIAVQGDDAVKFLQGQLTNDVALVDDSHSQLNAYCNNKGRMISNFRIFRSEGTLFISLPQELAETTLNKLQQYILRAQVAMGDVSDALLHIGVNGSKAAARLNVMFGRLPENTNEVAQFENAIVIRCAGDDRFELYATPEHMPAHWLALSGDCTPVGAGMWELQNIRNGIPVITSATSEAFVPQMTNLELLGGVSFTKGCYTGQEIVARMHYLGKLKQRMYRISIDTAEVPAAGEALSAQDATATQEVGTIISAQLVAEGKVEALAVIQNAYAQAGKLKLGSPDGPEISVLELPYSLESASQATK
jgi:folate-binding protein YgfZ